MKLGYIKINGEISQIFLNKTDEMISSVVEKLKEDLCDLNLTIGWDNFYSDKSLFDLVNFMKS